MTDPTNRILLPVDVTHANKELVSMLSALIPLQNADVLLLSVRESLPSYESVLSTVADFPEDFAHTFEKKARTVLEELQSQLSKAGASVRMEIVSGPAGMMIDQIARDEHYRIIALSPGSHSRVEQFFLGSTSSRVVKHADGTILLLRPSHDPELKQVVFGIDGSPQSHEAMKAAVKQFKLKERKVGVTLCHVVTIPSALTFVSPVEFVAAIENNLSMEGETILATAEKELAELGITDAELMLRHGDPSIELLIAVKHKKANLLVIGAQGRTAVQHFLLGSVSSRIAMHAPCSTAVIKPTK